MSRVDELQKKYPSFPRQILIKADVIALGIRDSDALYELGEWHRSAGTGSYESYDHDTTLKEMAAKRPTAVAKPGYVKRLGCFYLRGGWGVRIQRDSTSPYEIRETGSGKYGLFEGGEKVENVYFPQDKKPWPYLTREEPLTKSGKPITTVANLRSPNCNTVAPVRHCEYFATGEQCKFCNYNATQEDSRSVGAIRSVVTPLDEILEAYRILSSEVRLVDTTFVGGAIADRAREVNIYADFLGKLASAASYKPNFLLVMQPPKTRRDIQRLKDSGVDALAFDVEVWDPDLFAKICPGKAKHTGLERYKEAMVEAADVLGAGNACAVLVSGATLMLGDGHKTWQESRDVLIEAAKWTTKNGVLPGIVFQRWAPGSQFSEDPANRDRLPPIEHHLDVLQGVDAAMREHGLYEKMNRFAPGCPLCCLDHIVQQDLGIFEATNGNLSEWLAPVIPAEVDWLARLVDWIEESESVKNVVAEGS